MKHGLTIRAILKIINTLKEQGMNEKEIADLQVYIGDDEVLNGIHTAWYVQLIDSNKEDDDDFVRLVNDSRHNIKLDGKAILIS